LKARAIGASSKWDTDGANSFEIVFAQVAPALDVKRQMLTGDGVFDEIPAVTVGLKCMPKAQHMFQLPPKRGTGYAMRIYAID
jgi:hypothetical protein